jgi:SAM-dependent methyltransferase
VDLDGQLPVLSDAEREVADALPIGAGAEQARRVLRRVPLWFHTFALSAADGLYTPGVARDHRYRLPFLPASFAGQRVLDVGTFDGFYAFLAEHRGAARVVAVDNEQYVAWVKARWAIELEGGEGFRAIAELLGSRVEYLRCDAFGLADTCDRFDVILCFGILHRVENPLGPAARPQRPAGARWAAAGGGLRDRRRRQRRRAQHRGAAARRVYRGGVGVRLDLEQLAKPGAAVALHPARLASPRPSRACRAAPSAPPLQNNGYEAFAGGAPVAASVGCDVAAAASSSSSKPCSMPAHTTSRSGAVSQSPVTPNPRPPS